MSRPVTSRRIMSIEECLFGESKTCPSNVWDAVLSKPAEKSQSNGYLGIDDLNQGRWALPENQQHTIPIQELRRIASLGLPDHFRGVAWRVLLGELSLETSEWRSVLLEKRQHYRSLVADLFVDPQHDGNDLRGHHGKKMARAVIKRDYDLAKAASPPMSPESDTAILKTNWAAAPYLNNNGKALNQTPQKKSSFSESIQQDEMDPSVKISQARRRPLLSETMEQQLQLNRERDEEKHADTNQAQTVGALKGNANDTKIEKSYSSDEDNKSQESIADMVPAHIREEWKKSGRDTMTLDSMTGEHNQGMNTLLVNTSTPSKDGLMVSLVDDPQSPDSDAKWFQFYENASLLDEIRKDVVRTHPDLYFFLEPESNLGQRRYAALERILFVWAKLNKGVRYVQGMNEIVGTIYYVLANDEQEEWACEAEADAYFLFNRLMTEMRDIFVPDLDEADTGIQGRISNMTSLLSLHDPEVRCHLVDIGIDSAFFAIRWLTTLLSREFLLPDTIRLWDSMFASTHKDNFMRYVCVTMVMVIRDKLLKGDFSTCLRLLQAYPSTNIEGLLEASRALWIYESQVTLACHKGGIGLHQALCTITPPPSIIMAYGLPGGVARQRVVEQEPPPPSPQERLGSLLNRANAVLNQLGEAANRNRGQKSQQQGVGRNLSS